MLRVFLFESKPLFVRNNAYSLVVQEGVLSFVKGSS